jgi:predicted metal-dependent phosphotriesterase family hydrolase
MNVFRLQIKCIGQRGRTFNIGYKEHAQAITNNNSNSGYSNHILSTKHIWKYNTYYRPYAYRKERQTLRYKYILETPYL